VLVEEPCVARVSRHQKGEADTAHTSHATYDKEQDTPGCNGHVPAADGVHDERTKDLGNAAHGDPSGHTNWVFSTLVPVAGDDDEGRLNRTLCEAQEEANSTLSTETVDSTQAHFGRSQATMVKPTKTVTGSRLKRYAAGYSEQS
jgi:hypothetical protein